MNANEGETLNKYRKNVNRPKSKQKCPQYKNGVIKLQKLYFKRVRKKKKLIGSKSLQMQVK